MAVQWLGLCAFTVEVPVSIAGGGTRILQAVQRTPTPPPKIEIVYFPVCSKSLKSSVHFTLTAHLNSDYSYFNCSVATYIAGDYHRHRGRGKESFYSWTDLLSNINSTTYWP